MSLVLNEARFHEMSTSPHGAVGIHLAKTGVRVETAAKLLITNEGLVRSGRYRASIAWTFVSGAATLAIRVGSALPVARLIEHGTPPHVIRGRGTIGGNDARGGAAGLFWEQKPNVGSRNWFVPDHPLQAVNHPGTRAYMILHRAVASVLRTGGTQ